MSDEPVAFRFVHHDYAGRKVSRYGAYPERVNGNDPIETHSLYTSDAIQAAVAAERARCAGIAKTGWVSADYNVVGIADADVAMRLCEHIVTAIEGTDLESPCPVCSGDCSSANPPVIYCPMKDARTPTGADHDL